MIHKVLSLKDQLKLLLDDLLAGLDVLGNVVVFDLTRYLDLYLLLKVIPFHVVDGVQHPHTL